MELSVYILLNFLLAAVLAAMIMKSEKAFKYFISVIFISLFFNALEISVVNPGLKFIFNQLKFIGVVFIGPASLILYRSYMNIAITQKRLIFLQIPPVITLAVIATNSMHHLFLTEYHVEVTRVVSCISFVPGIWFWIHSLYSYALILVAFGVLLLRCWKKPAIYRGQDYGMIFGAMLSTVLNILVIMGVTYDYGDVSIVAFSITAVCHYWALYIYRPERLVSLARSFALNEISNPVFIFDVSENLLDVNRSGSEQLDSFRPETGCGHVERNGKIYGVSEKKLYDSRELYIGRVVVLNDITELTRTVDKLEYSLNHDALTGLNSLSAFNKHLLYMSAHGKMPLRILYFNIAGMRVINNVFGLETGESVIKTVARIICDEVGAGGMAARANADEFAAVIEGISEAEAQGILEAIREKCEEKTADGVFIGVYCGIAEINRRGENTDFALKTAIGATYQDKLRFSNQYYDRIFNSLEKPLNVNESPGHIERLRAVCGRMAAEYGLPPEEARRLDLLALTHDIGLLNAPDGLSERIGHMTNAEWEAYKLHTVRGHNIALGSEQFAAVSRAILSHHERYDGAGYPNRLKAGEIPLISRLFAAADFYDSLTHRKTGALSTEEALEEIRRHSGTMLDPKAVDVFLRCVGSEV